MKHNRLQERLDAADWPHVYAVITPWPQATGKRGVYYPGTDTDLYTILEAVKTMQRLESRGLTCRAFSSCDDFDLRDSCFDNSPLVKEKP
jgi:hypothetical protein